MLSRRRDAGVAKGHGRAEKVVKEQFDGRSPGTNPGPRGVAAVRPSPPAPKIVAAGLRQEFRDRAGRPVVALDGIDLAVAEGEFVCLVGPSGCGKTTLLRAIAGLERPTAGTVAIAHREPDRPAQALVFQGQSLFPWRTVLANAAYGLELRGGGRRAREAAARARLEQVGLGRFADAYPHQLSEGMRQRANLARALAVDPATLLMDEPFGNLDEQNRLLMQEELLRLWGAGARPLTVVFVTHSVDEALVLADRVVVLSARPGRIAAELRVPFARPRDPLALKGDPAYAALYRAIWGLLRDGVAAARAAELREGAA
jgi:NitT/TauT family transport system ATP-binding protein